MSDDLRRVGLVFTEKGAVDFKKSLQEVNIEMSKNYNQFKLTQAQWDSSTKSTEKLRQEQEYLKNAYEIQTDKVNTLKMQLSDLENAENKNVTAIKKKQNELTNAEVKLESYKSKIQDIESQLKNSGKAIEEFGNKIKNSGEKIEKAGKKVSAFSVASGTALLTCAKSAIDFEDAFTGVEKTVDGTEEQMANLRQGIRNMAKEIPSTTTEISGVAEAAGQLGIKTDDILSFTRVMIDLGNSTNLSAEEASSALAKFANITNMSAKDYDRLGSTIVDLGNNFATTEADIVEMSTRLAATGELAGLSQAQILSLATAMSSVGIEAEAGGSAMSKLLKKIQVSVETGSKDLKQFAKVAGMTTKDFKKAFEKDAVKALSAFISGLNDTKRNGKSAIAILDDMDIKEVRLSNTILSLASAGNLMNEAVEKGNKAWEDNMALTNEANKRYGTLKSQITTALSKIKDIAITVGEKLMPSIQDVINGFGEWIKKFENLSKEEVDVIVKIGLIITAIGPLITIIGKLTSAIGGTISGVGTFVQAIGVMQGKITSASGAVNGLASIMGAATSPIGLATIALAGLTAGLMILATRQTEAEKKAKEFAKEVENQKNQYEDYKRTLDESTNANLAQINSVSRLKEELKTLVDENGNVKKGYEGRVSFILNQLNEALGTEYKLNGNIIQNYKDLQGEIDNLIKKKKAEILLKNGESKWAKASEEEVEATKKLKEAYGNLGMSIEEAKAKLQKLTEEASQDVDENGTDYWTHKEITNLEALITTYENAESTVKQCTEDKKQYENNYALFVEEKYDEIGKIVTDSTKNYTDTSLQTIKTSIEQEKRELEESKQLHEITNNAIYLQQQEQAQKNLEELAKELQARTSLVDTLGKDETEAWKSLATNSYDTYSSIIREMDPTLALEIEKMTGVIAENAPKLIEETAKMTQELLDEVDKNSQFKEVALNDLRGVLNGLQDEELRELLKQAGVQNVDKVIDGIKQGNLGEEQGKDVLSKLNDGLKNKGFQNNVFNTARGIASKLSSLLSVKVAATGAGIAFDVATGKLPSHRTGLDYVPTDDYVARLHKGERVLTKEENREYTQDKKEEKGNTYNSKSAKYNFNMNVYCEKLDEKELDNIFNYINRRFGAEY